MTHTPWPHILPEWFWPWVRWKLGRGEYASYGPANPSVRPPNAPLKIPQWAWLRLRLNLFGTLLPLGLFGEKGALLRNPRGGVENFTEQAKYIRWTSCNVGDHSPSEWDYYLKEAVKVGITVIPWVRCRNENDVAKLLATAKLWGSPGLIINLEVEAKDDLPPAAVAAMISEYTGLVGISTEAWLYNSVDWTPLKSHTVLLQIFPQESAAAKDPNGCIAHAREMGFEKVCVTYGTYSNAEPGWYNLNKVNYSLYTGDDIGPGNWHKWFI